MKKRNFSLLLVLLLFAALVPTFVTPPKLTRAAAPNKVGVNLAGYYDTPYLIATARAVGEWGYVGILTSPDQSHRLQRFLDDCANLRLLPVIRISVAGGPGEQWERPQLRDALYWANRLNGLDWHGLPRIIAVNNEVNLDSEWGGKANPAEYADWLSLFSRTVKATARFGDGYTILMGSLTLGASDDSGVTIHPATFIKGMKAAIPDIFNQIDGIAANLYTIRPYPVERRWNFLGYREQLEWMGREMPVYILEEGLDPHFPYSDQDLADQIRLGWPTWQNDPLVVTSMPLAYVPQEYVPADMKHTGGFWFFNLDSGGNLAAVSRTFATIAEIASRPDHLPPASDQDAMIRAFLPTTGATSPGDVYFAEVRHSLDRRFVADWQRGGGLAMFGYPLHEAVMKGSIVVQYTERARFEWHSDGTGGGTVLFGLLGVESLHAQGKSFAAAPPVAGSSYFKESGHNLGGPLLKYWQERGGLATFGYPISEPQADGKLTVQYFERARLELHTDGTISLGRLGYELARRLDLKGYW